MRPLEANPVKLGLEVRGIWEGHSDRSTVHIGPYTLAGTRIARDDRHYTIPYGGWREVEEVVGFVGPTDRVEPVEMALGAVAACLSNSIALNAPRHGIHIDGMEVFVRTEVDPSVLFEVKGPESHAACMPKMTTEVRIKGDVTDEQLNTIKRLARYSPVHGLIEYPIQCETTVARA